MTVQTLKTEVIGNGIGGITKEKVEIEKERMRGADMVVRALEDEEFKSSLDFPEAQCSHCMMLSMTARS